MNNEHEQSECEFECTKISSLGLFLQSYCITGDVISYAPNSTTGG